MNNEAIIENLFWNPRDWNAIFNAALSVADRFSIVYAEEKFDEENPLDTGKVEFFHLPNLTVEPWQNMAGVNSYHGQLEAKSKKLFKKYMHAEDEREGYSLWNFTLFEGAVELLNVQDFNVAILNLESNLVRLLIERKINFSY